MRVDRESERNLARCQVLRKICLLEISIVYRRNHHSCHHHHRSYHSLAQEAGFEVWRKDLREHRDHSLLQQEVELYYHMVLHIFLVQVDMLPEEEEIFVRSLCRSTRRMGVVEVCQVNALYNLLGCMDVGEVDHVGRNNHRQVDHIDHELVGSVDDTVEYRARLESKKWLG